MGRWRWRCSPWWGVWPIRSGPADASTSVTASLYTPAQTRPETHTGCHSPRSQRRSVALHSAQAAREEEENTHTFYYSNTSCLSRRVYLLVSSFGSFICYNCFSCRFPVFNVSCHLWALYYGQFTCIWSASDFCLNIHFTSSLFNQERSSYDSKSLFRGSPGQDRQKYKIRTNDSYITK